MSDTTKKKTPRRYRLGRRAEAAEETRRRIVEATYALHSERGIADTSMKDIAERAGVSVGTVYHHFPTYENAIDACGAHAARTFPPPTATLFDGAAARPERIELLAHALFKWYERIPALPSVRRDRHLAASLEQFVAAEADNRLSLAAHALEATRRSRTAALVAALLDLDVYRALQRQGFDANRAAREMAAVINCWLDSLPH